jgi:CRP/FNR family transcriptional regulator
VHRLSKIAFLRFLESSPQFIGAIGDFVHREVWWSQRQIILLGRGSPEQKLMAWLFAWRERSKQDVGSSTDVRLPMMRKDIAEYLNLTIATVSRTLNRLKRERLIAITPTGIRIMDLDAAFALARSIDPTIGRQICSLSAISAQVLTRLTALLVPIAGRLAASCPEESLLALVA